LPAAAHRVFATGGGGGVPTDIDRRGGVTGKPAAAALQVDFC